MEKKKKRPENGKIGPKMGQKWPFPHFSAIFSHFSLWGQIHFSAFFPISGLTPEMDRAIGIATLENSEQKNPKRVCGASLPRSPKEEARKSVENDDFQVSLTLQSFFFLKGAQTMKCTLWTETLEFWKLKVPNPRFALHGLAPP